MASKIRLPFPAHIQRNSTRRVPQPQKPAINEVDFVEPTDGSVDPSEVIGREVEALFLLQDLLGDSGGNCNQFKALGIVGTAGSGKTTICQKMFNSSQVQKHFLPRIWVCMTRPPGDDADTKVIVTKRMLTCLGEDEEIIEKCENEISGLVSLLHRQLVGKRYLIVLDGACDADKWFNLGSDYSIQHKPDKGKNFTWVHSTDWGRSLAFGLPKGYGGAVIVNGRSDKVVEMMVGKENLHRLLPLRDEDCWAIFENTVANPERDPKAEEPRRFVVQGAGGHPLMAKLMGQCYEQVKNTTEQAAVNHNVTTGEESTAPKVVDGKGLEGKRPDQLESLRSSRD